MATSEPREECPNGSVEMGAVLALSNMGIIRNLANRPHSLPVALILFLAMWLGFTIAGCAPEQIVRVNVPSKLLSGTAIHLGQPASDITDTVGAFRRGLVYSSDSGEHGDDYYYAFLGKQLPFRELLVVVTPKHEVKGVTFRGVHGDEERDLDSLAVWVARQCIDCYGDEYVISDIALSVGREQSSPCLTWNTDTCRVSFWFTPQRLATRGTDGRYPSTVFFQLSISSQSEQNVDDVQPTESTAYTRQSLGLE